MITTYFFKVCLVKHSAFVRVPLPYLIHWEIAGSGVLRLPRPSEEGRGEGTKNLLALNNLHIMTLL